MDKTDRRYSQLIRALTRYKTLHRQELTRQLYKRQCFGNRDSSFKSSICDLHHQTNCITITIQINFIKYLCLHKESPQPLLNDHHMAESSLLHNTVYKVISTKFLRKLSNDIYTDSTECIKPEPRPR